MATKLTLANAQAQFKANDWQNQKGNWLFWLVNAFGVSMEHSVPLVEHLTDKSIEAMKEAQYSSKCTGKKEIVSKEIALAGQAGVIKAALQWAEKGKAGILVPQCSFVFAPAVVDYIGEIHAKSIKPEKP